MNVSDRPESPASDDLSFDDGVEDLTGLLGPEEDPDEPEGEPAEGEDEILDDEAEGDEIDDAGEDDAPEEPAFAADDLKVKMADGREITVAQLRGFADERAKEFQREFTRGQQELSEQRRRVDEAAQTIAQNRDFLLAVYNQIMPQAPDPSELNDDPIGYMQRKADYDQRMQQFQYLRQMQEHSQQQMQQETAQQAQERLSQERQALVRAMPELQDQAKFAAFRNDLVENASYYGVSEDEISSVSDHRQLLILKDAIAYRKLKASAAQKAKTATDGKPKLIQGSRRMDPKAKTSREKAIRDKRLQQTGDFDAGVAALMNLDL